ncbi:galactokinase [Candidatus Cyanaurora vandensis]|uniref:galactokinase n=1 Tax=Candidatus Cyanaurora vandensis TaxID=2714958 RepID=UPI00257FF251|nr:galactokinase [Candidatus Cyanaurora vandensis]
MMYATIFGQPPTVTATAPGRVNLLGEHTDYNDGFVLPTVIPQFTTVQMGFNKQPDHHFYSENLQESQTIPAHPPQGFARYLWGCIQMVESLGYTVPPLAVYVTSTVPIGSGLSSSAALEIAMLRAMRELLDLKIDDVKLAQLGQQAEIQYAGVACGIMDQMASSLATTGRMLFLDTRTLERRVLPFPPESEILVLDSGIPRTLAGSGYNQRRKECERAAAQLGVKALRDITNPALAQALPHPLNLRARHVITENNRVLNAAQGISAPQFGELMNSSHASLRDDYQVSVPGLDILVNLLQHSPGVYGARLTGAGFGGACVALVQPNQAPTIAQQVLAQYAKVGYQGKLLVP